MRFFILIPTTGGPIVLKSLKTRAGLPASTAFAEGDFRPLPWSSDYARLCATALASVISGLVPHELRISGSFDAGRSWEVPVTLAHLVIARGHEIVADLDDADVLVWATGAVDLDLVPIAGDYAVADKLALSKAFFEKAKGKKVLFVAPASSGSVIADWQSVTGIKPAGNDSLPVQLDRFLGDVAPTAPQNMHAVSQPQRKGKMPYGAGAVIFMVLAAAGSYAMWRSGQGQVKPDPMPVENKQEAKPVVTPVVIPKAPEKPSVLLFELRADAAGGCRKLLFGTGPVKRLPLAAKEGVFASSILDAGMCGIALKSGKANAKLVISGALAAASLPPTAEEDGTLVYLLKANPPQNIVYQVQVEGDPSSFRHEVMRSTQHEGKP
jgi:hypothetical protein